MEALFNVIVSPIQEIIDRGKYRCTVHPDVHPGDVPFLDSVYVLSLNSISKEGSK